MSVNNYTDSQKNTMNHIADLIVRGYPDSAREIAQLKQSDLGEKLSRNILNNLSFYSTGDMQRLVCYSIRDEDRIYEILSRDSIMSIQPVSKSENLHAKISKTFFNHPDSEDLLKKVIQFADISDLFIIRTVNKRLLKIVNQFLENKINIVFPNLFVGLVQKTNDVASIFFQNALINHNIEKGKYKYEIISDTLSCFFSTHPNTGKKVNEYLKRLEHEPLARYTAMHVHGNNLAVFNNHSFFSGVKIWDLSTKKIWQYVDCPDSLSEFPPRRKNFRPKMKMLNDFLYVTNKNHTINVWDLNRGIFLKERQIIYQDNDSKRQELKGHSQQILDTQVNGQYLFSASKDKSIKIWDRETGETITNIESEEININDILVSENCIYGKGTDQICIWDIRSGTLVQTISHARQGNSFGLPLYLNMKTDATNLYLVDRSRIYVRDLRKPTSITKSYKISSNMTVLIQDYSPFVVDGNYFFVAPVDYSSFEWYPDHIIEAFDKKNGKSKCVLSEGTLFKRVSGMREHICEMQMHQGVLYTLSSYTNHGFWYGLEGMKYERENNMTVKAWDFNHGQLD